MNDRLCCNVLFSSVSLKLEVFVAQPKFWTQAEDDLLKQATSVLVQENIKNRKKLSVCLAEVLRGCNTKC